MCIYILSHLIFHHLRKSLLSQVSCYLFLFFFFSSSLPSSSTDLHSSKYSNFLFIFFILLFYYIFCYLSHKRAAEKRRRRFTNYFNNLLFEKLSRVLFFRLSIVFLVCFLPGPSQIFDVTFYICFVPDRLTVQFYEYFNSIIDRLH
jgi:hypothetical protein